MFSELFYTNLFIGFSGMILACGALFYRSKCDKVNICCGLISIHRNIESELKNDLKGKPFTFKFDETTTKQVKNNMMPTSHIIQTLQDKL